ncbi:MAG: glycosyltransferase family 2 protein [Legionella sp.]|nr:glycosyltransferase family 2 protein [Legionella sp.]
MPNTRQNKQHVTILLATYNGERHIKEQLNSITKQTHPYITTIASDDGSTDKTLDILQDYSIKTHKGPEQGFAANFFNLIEQADKTSDYYAFCDQDDVWDPNKIERAVNWFATINPHTAALYCTRTLLVDEQLNPLGHSPLFKKTPHFLNALVQNVGGGNTMVFNQAACKLICQTGKHHDLFAHDWWAYLLISGAGGPVFYDPTPSLRYRQHQGNLIGNNLSWRARYGRIRMLFQGNLKAWITQNNKNLLAVSHLLTPEHRQQLETFELSRHRGLFRRVFSILRLGIHRQTKLTQIGLLVGTVFNKT